MPELRPIRPAARRPVLRVLPSGSRPVRRRWRQPDPSTVFAFAVCGLFALYLLAQVIRSVSVLHGAGQ